MSIITAMLSLLLVAGAEGFASFWLTPPDREQSFDVSASLEGFRKGEIKEVRFGTCEGDCRFSRYVQLRLAYGPRTDQ